MFSIDLCQYTPDTNTGSELAAATSTLPHVVDGNYTVIETIHIRKTTETDNHGRQNVLTRKYKTDLKLNKQEKWMHTLPCGMLGSTL
jgi:hypothetical protein